MLHSFYCKREHTHMIFCVFLLFVCDVFSYSCCDVVVIVLVAYHDGGAGGLFRVFGNSITTIVIKCVQMKQLLPGWQKPSIMPFLGRWCGSYSSS